MCKGHVDLNGVVRGKGMGEASAECSGRGGDVESSERGECCRIRARVGCRLDARVHVLWARREKKVRVMTELNNLNLCLKALRFGRFGRVRNTATANPAAILTHPPPLTCSGRSRWRDLATH